MDIIIVGAGQVGSTVAENLSAENNNVTVIDNDAERLRNLQNRLDIRTVVGSGSYPAILREAGADAADMLIAVSNNDEVNMIACQVAYSLFRIPTKIARIRAHDYFVSQDLFGKDDLPIDFFISPEQEITRYISHLIDFRGALQVLDFTNGRVRMVAFKPLPGAPMVGKTIGELPEYLPGVPLKIVAIYRANRAIPVSHDTIIQLNDEIFFVTDSRHVRAVMGILRHVDQPNRRIMIAGGGNIGRGLAQALQDHYQVKLIDHNISRSYAVAQALDHTTVLLGEASDKALLMDENIDHVDVFCALTNDDEANIISAIQAKRLGARQVVALVTRTNYVDLIEGGEIDIVISPQLITINGILTHLRQGDIVNVYSLRRGAAEAIEVVAHGDETTSQVVGRRLEDIKLPPETTIGAIVRNDEVIIGQAELKLEPDDHVILFLTAKQYIHEVERLFQVNVTYF